MLQAIIVLSTSDCCHDSTLAHRTRIMGAASVAHLVAINEALPPNVLEGVMEYMRKAADHAGCGQYLATAMWCLCRHAANRKGILLLVRRGVSNSGITQ